MYVVGRKVLKFLGILSIVLTLLFLIYLFRTLNILQHPDALAQLLKGHLLLGSLFFLLLQIIQVVIPIIPGGVTTVVGFMAFGPWLGFLLNYIGIIIGSIILFILARHFGKMFILLFVSEKTYYHYERRLTSPTYESFFILNMISPISPADILVMVTGLGKMSLKRFVVIILLAKPISIVVYSYFWIFGGRLLT